MMHVDSARKQVMVKQMQNTKEKERDRPVIHFIKHNHLADTKASELSSSLRKISIEQLSNFVSDQFVSSSVRTSAPKPWTA